MTFDDKPEANTYVKWARQKGYLVEGPYREKLSKKAKKFDLDGKAKKYRYVVMRKRGAGREGGSSEDAVRRKFKEVKAEMNAKGIRITDENIEKIARAYVEGRGTVTTMGGGIAPSKAKAQAKVVAKGDREAQLKLWWGGAPQSEKIKLAAGAGYRSAVSLKLPSELSQEQVEKLAEASEKHSLTKWGKVAQKAPEDEPVLLYRTDKEAGAEVRSLKATGYKNAAMFVKHKGDDPAAGIEGYHVRPGEKEEPKGEPVVVRRKPGKPVTTETKAGAKALEDSLVTAGYSKKEMHEKLITDAEKMLIGSKSPPEPKKRGRPPKVAVAEKREVPSPESMAQAFGGKKATMGVGKGEWEKVLREKAESIAKEEQKRQRESHKAVERDVSRQKEREQRAIEETVARRQTAGEFTPSQAEIMARAAERAKERKAFEESEKKLKEYEKETKLSKAQIRGKGWQRTMAKEAAAPEKAEEERQKERVGEQAKAERAWEREAKSRDKKAKKEATKQAARQESARKRVTKEYLKRGETVPAGVTDYVAEKEKLATRKAAEIGRKKVARAERAEQEKKYAEKVTPTEGKWTYEEAQAKAREMAKGEAVEEKSIGPIKFRQAQKRKTYILRGKRPGEYKVVAGTKKELETPTSLKAALAKEKRKYKKRKKLLEKPLREIKRAKKVLRTTSRHAGRQLLRKPSSLVPTRGKHPAIGNVSMEYHRARIATPILVPRSIATEYVT